MEVETHSPATSFSVDSGTRANYSPYIDQPKLRASGFRSSDDASGIENFEYGGTECNSVKKVNDREISNYKKTKEGKAGRQDGKHYRFFRQLEALYGETSNNNNHQQPDNTFYSNNNVVLGNHLGGMKPSKISSDSLSLSENSSDFESTSSGDSGGEKGKKRKGRRSWKCKIKDFIDQKMIKLMEKQEAWLEKMMNTIEQKEKERMVREEEWRKERT